MARAVADRAERKGRGNDPPGRPPRTPQQNCDPEVDGGRTHRLEPYNRDRVLERQSLRQVVVDRPRRTRGSDQNHPPRVAAHLPHPAAQDRTAQHDRCSRQPTSRSEMLPEHHNRQHRRKRCLEVQQQRPRHRRHAFQADEKQQRPNDPTKDHDRHQRRQVTAAQRGFFASPASPSDHQDHGRARIQQPRKQLRVAMSDETLRKRSAQPERRGRQQSNDGTDPRRPRRCLHQADGTRGRHHGSLTTYAPCPYASLRSARRTYTTASPGRRGQPDPAIGLLPKDEDSVPSAAPDLPDGCCRGVADG